MKDNKYTVKDLENNTRLNLTEIKNQLQLLTKIIENTTTEYEEELSRKNKVIEELSTALKEKHKSSDINTKVLEE